MSKVIFSTREVKNGIEISGVDSERLVTIRQKNGEIKTEWKSSESVYELIWKLSYLVIKVSLFIGVLAYSYVLTCRILESIRISLVFAIIYQILEIMLRKLCVNRNKMNAAKNMMINAYYNIIGMPTIQELREFDKFSYTSVINGKMEILMITICLYFTTFITNERYVFLAIIFSIAIPHILKAIGAFNIFQILMLSDPTDQELEIAVKAIQTWENEKE